MASNATHAHVWGCIVQRLSQPGASFNPRCQRDGEDGVCLTARPTRPQVRAAPVTVVFAADMESSKLTDRVVRLAVESGAPRAFTDNLPMYISMFGGGHQSALVRNAAYGLKAGLLNAVRPMLPTPPKAPSINAPEAWCVVYT